MAIYRAWGAPGLAALLLASSVTGFEPDRDAAARAQLIQVASDGLAGPVLARIERVVDGDTVDVSALIWLGQTLTVRVRILGIDTPELRGACAEERDLAMAAREFLRRRLEGGEVRLTAISYDKYGGRVLARVSDREGDIADAMIAAGLARAYDGGARVSWCAG